MLFILSRMNQVKNKVEFNQLLCMNKGGFMSKQILCWVEQNYKQQQSDKTYSCKFVFLVQILFLMLSDLSQTKLYRSKTQPNQDGDRSNRQTPLPYINPVIKHTLDSLPLIYGGNVNRKRKYNILSKSKFDVSSVLSRSHAKSVHQNERLYTKLNQNFHENHRGQSCLEMNKQREDLNERQQISKTVMKQNRYISKSPDLLSNKQQSKSQATSTPKRKKQINLQVMHNLSKPREFCNKQYCSCKSLYHEYKEEIKKKLKEKSSKNSSRKQNFSKIQLPRLSVDLHRKSPGKLDDQESKHKVNFKYKINSLEDEVSQNHSTCILCHKDKRQKSTESLQLKGLLGLIKKKQLEEKKRKLTHQSNTQNIGIQSDMESINESQIKNEDFGIQADLVTSKKKLSTIDQQINTDFDDEKKDFKYLQNNKNLKDSSTSKLKKQPLQHLSHLKQVYKYKKRPTYESKYGQNQEDEQDCGCENQDSYKSPIKNKRNSQLKRSKKGVKQQEEQFDIDLESDSVMSQKSLMNHLAKALINGQKDKSTIFKKLKKKQQESQNQSLRDKSKNKKRSKNKKKQKNMNLINEETGLFAIPEEQQYVDYLKSYKPISKDFKIKNLIKSQNFKILKYNDTLYFGETDAQNRKHGKALCISSKQIFEGVYQNGIKMSGCQRNIDGVYVGEFLNGQRHGKGKWLWNNGQIYEGQWKLGTKSGHGIWKSPKGDSYEGQWLLNRQQGKGIHRHKSSTYEGQFVQSLKQGKGKEKFVNGDQYIGQYLRGKPHGKGKYNWKNGQYYEGQFKNGLRDGFGKWSFSPKAYYEGEFKGDFKHGKGKEFMDNGDQYEGQYFEGAKSNGILIQGSTGKKIEIRPDNKLEKSKNQIKQIGLQTKRSREKSEQKQVNNQQEKQRVKEKNQNEQSLIEDFLKNSQIKPDTQKVNPKKRQIPNQSQSKIDIGKDQQQKI